MQKSFAAVIGFTCFFLLGFFVHAKEKIATPHFSLLFDKSATKSAQCIANTLETLYQPVSKTLGVCPSPIRLLVNNQSTQLNAYFKPLPRHISFYTLHTSDPYFVGNADWLNMLSIHEFRHAVQHSIEYHSTPLWLRPLYFVGNVVAVCGVCSFFKEGDAVGMETALSKSGRGRLPEWEKLYKVNLLERGAASFSRQLFGSLKYEMPDEYHIGYYFTTHLRRKYGSNAIKSIYEATLRGMPYFGFYNAIKKVTKKSILKVYKEMNQELLLSWQKQLEGLKITPATQLTIKKPNDSFDYINPFMDASGRLMAWKQGIGLRDQLVEVRISPSSPAAGSKIGLSSQKDKIICYFKKDSLPPSPTCVIGEGCAAWLEGCRHPWKWDKQTIRLQHYDFKQRKRRTLVSSSRYTALAMSPNTQQLVAVTTDKAGSHFLVVLETKSGKVVKKIDNPDGGYYLTPSWSGEDHIIVVKTKDQKNSIVRINRATSKEEMLLPYSYEHRSHPRIYKDYLLYNSPYNGIDNIYAMHLPTKACFQVTSRKYGAYLGMVDPVSNQLVFSDYTKNGMEIAVMPFDPLLWTPLEAVEDRSVRYYEPLVVQEKNDDILEKVPNHLYPLTKYHAAKDNLAFIGTNVEPNWEDRGLKIEPFSLVNLDDSLKVTPYFYQNFNILNKVRNGKYKTSELGLKVRYATFYPILQADIKCNRYKPQKDYAGLSYKWQEIITGYVNPNKVSWVPELTLSIKLPYYFTLGSSSGKAYLKARMHLSQGDKNQKIGCTQEYTFGIHNYSTRSRRDIEAPWAQEFSISYSNAKSRPNLLRGWESLISCNAIFSVPGIGNHHYFSVNPKFERCKGSNTEPFWVHNMNLTYGFPLAHPECGIPLIWFLEKIWMAGYYRPILRKITQVNNPACAFEKRSNIPDIDTIGIQLFCTNRFLINKNIPYAQVWLDFDLFKKGNQGWEFEFPIPKFEFKFIVEAKRDEDVIKKN